MSDNLSHLTGRKGVENSLFEKLLEDAKKNGSPVNELQKKLAEDFLVGDANVYGTTTFYDFLKPENQKHKVGVCTGSACLLAGTQDKLKQWLGKDLQKEEIGNKVCLGRCHENFAFSYEGRNYSAKSEDEVHDIIQNKKGDNIDNYSVGCSINTPILTPENLGLNELYQNYKELLASDQDKLLQELKNSNLRGRGGAGFPIGLKLESCKSTESNQKFIVCNADEGDPGAYSDRYIMEKQPHLLLYGMILAGYIVGANKGVLYIRGEYPESVEIVGKAIRELEDNNLLGIDILGSGFDFSFKIIEGAGAYICGEETSLLSSIEGQRAEVRVRPPYPTQQGLFNQPTAVNNVETLASIYWILKNGGEAYAKIGTTKSTGTKLVSLDSFVNNPGIFEIEMGTSLPDVIENFGRGFKQPIKAIHVGGPLGGIVPTYKIPELTLDFESFAETGFLLGHAGIICIPETFPMVKYLEHLFEFTADESCGKCFPCSIGSIRGKELFEKSINEGYKIDRQLLDDLLETLEVGSLCALGGGLPLGIKNALEHFKDELKEHFS